MSENVIAPEASSTVTGALLEGSKLSKKAQKPKTLYLQVLQADTGGEADFQNQICHLVREIESDLGRTLLAGSLRPKKVETLLF